MINILLVGKSGAGKTTLLHGKKRLITYTTRAKREEESSEEYHFITVSDFKKKIKAGFFVEYSKNHGNFYGIAKKDFKGCICIVSQEGASKLKKMGFNCIIKQGEKFSDFDYVIKTKEEFDQILAKEGYNEY